MTEKTLTKIQGCLLGVLIGDAMGMPVETMSQEEVLAATSSRGVEGFITPLQKRFSSIAALEAGQTTDDWQLTQATAWSIIRCRGFHIYDLARAHVSEYRRTSAGWGGTTRRGVADIADYFTSEGAHGRDPSFPARELGDGKGCGNGVAMKISPLALFHAIREKKFEREPLFSQVMEFGLMTHPDPRASFAAYAIAVAIVKLMHQPLSNDVVSRKDFLSDLLQELVWMERRYRGLHRSEDTFLMRMRYLERPGLLEDPSRLRREVGTECLALESVPFAIGTFLRHPTDFRAGVLEAVNAGGDTDSNAAMVGALIGANCGLEAIPASWQNFRTEYAEALRLGEALFWQTARSEQ